MARTPRAEDAPLLRGGGRRETSAAHGPAVWLSIGMVVAGLMVLAIGAVPWGRAHVALVHGALYHPDTASKHSEVRRAEKVAPDGTETHARAPSQPEREWEDDRRDPSALGDGDGETDETNERMRSFRRRRPGRGRRRVCAARGAGGENREVRPDDEPNLRRGCDHLRDGRNAGRIAHACISRVLVVDAPRVIRASARYASLPPVRPSTAPRGTRSAPLPATTRETRARSTPLFPSRTRSRGLERRVLPPLPLDRGRTPSRRVLLR